VRNVNFYEEYHVTINAALNYINYVSQTQIYNSNNFGALNFTVWKCRHSYI